MQKLLQVHHVSKVYGKHQALEDISLAISSGKIVGLLGPNGSGKTTLIKLINGLLKQTSGEIVVDGFHPSPDSKKIIAYLPDTSYLNENFSVKQALDMFKDFYEDFNYKKAKNLLVDLKIDAKEKIKNLSKGNKEKVQLILVMSRRAKLYILDEPIGGVDPAARDYILKTIINNYSEEASVLISTHLIADVEQVLDDVVFLKEGKIVLQGNSDDIRFDHGKSIDALFRETFQN